MKNIVFVNGNIYFKTGSHTVKELISYASDKWRRLADITIDNDLVVESDSSIEPNNIYCASGEISLFEINNVNILLHPLDIEYIYRQEINNLEELMKQGVSENLTNVLYRQIFIGVIGAMELFLEEFMHSMVLGIPKYYKRYCEQSSREFKLKEIAHKEWKVQYAVIKSIRETIYHQIQSVKNKYKKVLGVNFNSVEKLEMLIKTRHELVHRNGRTGTIGFIVVGKHMINELIAEVNALVDNIMETRRYEIENWLPVFTKKQVNKE